MSQLTITVQGPDSLSVNGGPDYTLRVGPVVQVVNNGAGSDNFFEAIAGETLPGGRAVYISGGKAWLYDPANTALIGRVVGITTGAALQNALAQIQTDGVMNWTGTALVDGASYFAGAGGQLSSNPAGLIALVRVGHAIAINKLKLSFDLNIQTI